MDFIDIFILYKYYNMNKIIIKFILMYLLIFLLLYLYTIDLQTINFKNIIKHNSIATLNLRVHNKLFNLLNLNEYINNISILEIGSGNGLSTKRFMDYLHKNKIKYNYTICECDNNYKNILNKKFKNSIIYIDKWQNIVSKGKQYDIILTTSFSTINLKNYKIFKKLCNKNTIILTVLYFTINTKYGFKILKKTSIGLCKLYLFKPL